MRTIPVAPILVPLTLVAVVALLWRLHARGRLTALRALTVVVVCVYAAGVIGHVMPYEILTGSEREARAMPWRVYLHLTPLVEIVKDPAGIRLNTLLFVPLGLLLPLLARMSLRRALVIGFVISLSIEVVQFIAVVTVSTGRVADVDDVIANVLGTAIGYLVLRGLVRVPALARLADAAALGPAPGA